MPKYVLVEYLSNVGSLLALKCVISMHFCFLLVLFLSYYMSVPQTIFCYIIDFLLQYLGQRKKQEAEERRFKLKKAREDYKKMLEVSCLLFLEMISILIDRCNSLTFSHSLWLLLQESVELTSSTRWRFEFCYIIPIF